MKSEKSVMDEIIEETKETYRKMSLVELLAEETKMTEFLSRRGADTMRKRLQEILRSEIEGRLL